jgi:hypothetical protein
MLLSIVAVLAMSAVVASAAFGAEKPSEQQQFNKLPAKAGVTGVSGVSVLTAGGQKVTCIEDTSKGTVWGPGLINNIRVVFKGCTSTNKTEKCEVLSKGKPNGEIETNELQGELGEVAVKESTTGVGLLLEPISGNVFVVLEGKCLPVTPTAVEGSVAGEVTPTGPPKSKEGKVVFAVTAGAQNIKKFERGLAEHCKEKPECKEDGKISPKLTVFNGKAATEETTDTNTFEEELEVLPGV